MAASPRRRKPAISASRRCWRIWLQEEIAALAELSTARRYQAGQRIVCAGEPANSLFFLQSGMVSVKLPSGVRLASLGPGMEFGEMAIIEQYRSADVWADTPVTCLELPLDSFDDYRRLHPQIAMKIMRNLSACWRGA